MPAPTSPSFGACSKIRTWKPRFIRQAAAASPPGPAPAMRTLPATLVRLDARRFDGVAPDRRLASHQLGEFRWRVAERLDADLAQALGSRRLARCFRHRLRRALDDRLRRAGGREDAVPGAGIESGIGLGDRRN